MSGMTRLLRFASTAKSTAAPPLLSGSRFFSTPGSALLSVTDDVDGHVSAAHARIVKKLLRMGRSKVTGLENVEEVIESTVAFLEDRFGFSQIRAIKTIALHPMIITYNKETMDTKLAWMAERGISKQSMRMAMKRQPCIIGRSAASLEVSIEWFLNLGIAPSKIGFIVSVVPQAMSMTHDLLDRKLETLRQIGLDHTHILRIMTRFPQVLAVGVDVLQEKAQWARAWGLSQEELNKLLSTAPEFLSLSLEQVERKLAVLDELFGAGASKRLWSINFRFIMTNSDQLRESFKFLTTVVGMPVEKVRVPQITRRVDRILRPRYQFLTQHTNVDVRNSVRNSVQWIAKPETEFIEQYPEYEEFKAQLIE